MTLNPPDPCDLAVRSLAAVSAPAAGMARSSSGHLVETLSLVDWIRGRQEAGDHEINKRRLCTFSEILWRLAPARTLGASRQSRSF